MSVSTPCIGICKLDPETGLCIGCRRSRAEIALWPSLPEERRLAIMAQLARRQAPAREGASKRGEEETG